MDWLSCVSWSIRLVKQRAGHSPGSPQTSSKDFRLYARIASLVFRGSFVDEAQRTRQVAATADYEECAQMNFTPNREIALLLAVTLSFVTLTCCAAEAEKPDQPLPTDQVRFFESAIRPLCFCSSTPSASGVTSSQTRRGNTGSSRSSFAIFSARSAARPFCTW